MDWKIKANKQCLSMSLAIKFTYVLIFACSKEGFLKPQNFQWVTRNFDFCYESVRLELPRANPS
jgi:hypothetical protein